jgi:hypothetical protein
MSNWKPVPPPPAPTGINQFPATPPTVQVSQTSLPDQKEGIVKLFIGEIYNDLTGQILTVTGHWQKVVSFTASPTTPFSQTDSVTTGTSTTDTTTNSFSASLGVAGSLGSISASMTHTFSHSVTLSESKTISQEFQVIPKTGEVSAIWWQLVHTYTITGTSAAVVAGERGPSQAFTKQLVSTAKTFVSSTYPASPGLTTQGFESFTEAPAPVLK